MLWPLKCIKLKCLKCFDNFIDRYKLYSFGEHKFAKDINIDSFITMKRNLKTVVRLLMTKQQRKLAVFSKLNTISLDSSKSSSNDSVDMSMPKMLDRGKARQQYIEVVDTLIDECKKKNQTLNDLKLFNEICTNKELSCINFENENINEDNISENFYNK